VPIKRSVNNIVNPAANTGNDNNNKIAVKNIAQPNNGTTSNTLTHGVRIFKKVTIKFTAPAIDDTPATCKLKIAKSTAGVG